MKEIILLGGGGHCKSLIDVIESENRFKIAGIIDKKELIGSEVLGYKIIGSDNDLEKLREKFEFAFIAIGFIKSNKRRVELFELLKKFGFKLPTIISPFAYVSKYSIIEEGSVIHHGAIVNGGVKIGRNCIINSKALIEHDAIIEDNCHISTGAIINGGVKVGCNSFIGSGAITKEYITIKEDSFIKAGSVAYEKWGYSDSSN